LASQQDASRVHLAELSRGSYDAHFYVLSVLSRFCLYCSIWLYATSRGE